MKTEAERDDVESSYDDDEDLVESIEALSKNLGRIMKRMDRRSSGGVPQSVQGAAQNTRNSNPPRKNKPAESNPDSRNRRSNIQCRECEGFGHIQSECANTRKKSNKSFNSTWSDEDSDGNREEEAHVSNQVALTTRSAGEKTVSESVPPHAPQDDLPEVNHQISTNYSDSSDEEELTDEVIMKSYKDMHHKWMQVAKLNEKLLREKKIKKRR